MSSHGTKDKPIAAGIVIDRRNLRTHTRYTAVNVHGFKTNPHVIVVWHAKRTVLVGLPNVHAALRFNNDGGKIVCAQALGASDFSLQQEEWLALVKREVQQQVRLVLRIVDDGEAASAANSIVERDGVLVVLVMGIVGALYSLAQFDAAVRVLDPRRSVPRESRET